MNTSSMAYNNVEEEADKWLEKSSWDSSMPGLRKNYPSSLQSIQRPAVQILMNGEIRSNTPVMVGRIVSNRYRLNKQSIHTFCESVQDLTPSASESNATGEGREDLSKTVSNQIGAPKEGSRATTPGLLNEDDNASNNEPKKSLEPRPIAWVMKSLRGVYDDKLLAECAAFRNGFQAPTLPEYLCEWASVKYGVHSWSKCAGIYIELSILQAIQS